MGLDQNSWHLLHGMAKSMYLDGHCYEFASALSGGLGWDMCGLITGTSANPTIRHVVAKSRDGKFWDVRGLVRQNDIGRPFGIKELSLRPVTLEELRRVRPVEDLAIERASLTAQALWPKLPWRKDAFSAKVLKFMDDLERLCRSHGVWIRAPYPTAMPVICQAFGDEAGFSLSPTGDGQYFFDRELEKG